MQTEKEEVDEEPFEVSHGRGMKNGRESVVKSSSGTISVEIHQEEETDRQTLVWKSRRRQDKTRRGVVLEIGNFPFVAF